MISKFKLILFSLLLLTIFSCGGDGESKTIGKNSNVAPGLANSSENNSGKIKDNIFRMVK